MKTEAINFNQEGLNVAVICGIHGNETQTIRSVQEMKNRITTALETDEEVTKKDFKNIKTLWFVFGANSEGLKTNDRLWTNSVVESNNDLNRAFGRPVSVKEKNFTETVEFLKSSVDHYDVVIDVHNSPNCIPCFCVDYGMPKTDEILGFASRMEKDILQPVLRVSGAPTLKNYVNGNMGTDHKHIGFTVEFGGMGLQPGSENDIRDNSIRLEKFIKETGFFQDNLSMVKYSSNYCAQELMATKKGILKPVKNKYFTTYKKGEEMFKILSIDGIELETVYAPCDCVLIDTINTYYFDPKSCGFGIGEIQPIGDNPFSKQIFDKGF